MLLLDTNVVSEIRKIQCGRGNASVAEWMNHANADDLYVSVVTLHELEVGVRMLEAKDARQGSALREWLEMTVIPGFSGRTIAVDEVIARRAAQLHVPNRSPINDAYIAATAIVRGMTVVTRDLKDFQKLGVAVLSPWAP